MEVYSLYVDGEFVVDIPFEKTRNCNTFYVPNLFHQRGNGIELSKVAIYDQT